MIHLIGGLPADFLKINPIAHESADIEPIRGYIAGRPILFGQLDRLLKLSGPVLTTNPSAGSCATDANTGVLCLVQTVIEWWASEPECL